MVEYKKAFKRPFQDKRKLLIGVIIVFILSLPSLISSYFFKDTESILSNLSSFVFSIIISIILFIILSSFVYGFYINCAKSAMERKYKLPKWKNWKSLFNKGIKTLFITLIYFIPLAILIVIMVVSKFFSYDPTSTENLLATGILILVFILLIFLVGILTSYLIPMALMHFVEKGKFKDAFNFSSVLKKAFTGTYLVTLLVIILYGLAITIGYLILFSIFELLTQFSPELLKNIIAIIFNIISAFISFIISVSFYTLLGEIYPKLK